MKVSIIAFGTRGDVQPLLALGKALKNNGHSVCMASGSNFKQWVEGHGLGAAACRVDVQAIMDGAQDWLKHGNNPMVNMRVMRRLYLQHGRAMAEDAWAACQGAQVVIGGMLSEVYAVSIAEKLRARYVSALLQPAMIATRSGAATFNAPVPARNSIFNYLFTKTLVESFAWNLYGDIANKFRAKVLDLPSQTQKQNNAARKDALVLHGYSPHVIPHPDDWPSSFHTTGYWFLEEEQIWQPQPQLVDFIEAGSPPVCVGFGSMAASDAPMLTKLFTDAITRSGERAVLLAGWSGMDDMALPSSIFKVASVPHEWLFPRLKAVIHHGGAGTTAAGLRAGIPTVVVPHLADQAFWGKRVELLGVGPGPIPREKLTAAALANAIHIAVTNERMKRNAKDLGERIRAEDGIDRAVKLIEGDPAN